MPFFMRIVIFIALITLRHVSSLGSRQSLFDVFLDTYFNVQSLKRREESGKLNHWEFSKITANLILTIWFFCVFGPKTPPPQPNKHSGHDTWTWPTCNLIWTCALPTCCHIPIISRSFGNKKKWWLSNLFHKGNKKTFTTSLLSSLRDNIKQTRNPFISLV